MLTQTLFPVPLYQTYGKLVVEKKVAFGQSGIPLKDLTLFENVAKTERLATPLISTLRESISNESR